MEKRESYLEGSEVTEQRPKTEMMIIDDGIFTSKTSHIILKNPQNFNFGCIIKSESSIYGSKSDLNIEEELKYEGTNLSRSHLSTKSNSPPVGFSL